LTHALSSKRYRFDRGLLSFLIYWQSTHCRKIWVPYRYCFLSDIQKDWIGIEELELQAVENGEVRAYNTILEQLHR